MAPVGNLVSLHDRHFWKLLMICHDRLLFLIAWKRCLPFISINFDELGGWLCICDIGVRELIFELAFPGGDHKCVANGRSRSLLNSFGSSTGSDTSDRTGGGVSRSFFDCLLAAPAFQADALFPAKAVDALVAAGKELSAF